MIAKLLSWFVMGPLLAMVPAFFFFVGLKSSYFDALQIPVFYNLLFVDSISWPIFIFLALVLGFFFVFFKKPYMGVALFVAVSLASAVTLIPSVGKDIGFKLFSKTPFHIKKGRFTYTGKLLFEGRKSYFLLDDESKNMIEFKKESIDEAY